MPEAGSATPVVWGCPVTAPTCWPVLPFVQGHRGHLGNFEAALASVPRPLELGGGCPRGACGSVRGFHGPELSRHSLTVPADGARRACELISVLPEAVSGREELGKPDAGLTRAGDTLRHGQAGQRRQSVCKYGLISSNSKCHTVPLEPRTMERP